MLRRIIIACLDRLSEVIDSLRLTLEREPEEAVQEAGGVWLYVDKDHENADDGNSGTDPNWPLKTHLQALANARAPQDQIIWVMAKGRGEERWTNTSS